MPVLVVMFLAADRGLEVSEAVAELPRDLRQTLWPQDQQRDDQDEEQMSGLEDVPDH
jgi:hypothetical protein